MKTEASSLIKETKPKEFKVKIKKNVRAEIAVEWKLGVF